MWPKKVTKWEGLTSFGIMARFVLIATQLIRAVLVRTIRVSLATHRNHRALALALQRALPFEVKQRRTAKTGGIWFQNVESPIGQTEFGHGCPLDLMPSKPCSKPQLSMS